MSPGGGPMMRPVMGPGGPGQHPMMHQGPGMGPGMGPGGPGPGMHPRMGTPDGLRGMSPDYQRMMPNSGRCYPTWDMGCLPGIITEIFRHG